MGQKPFRANGPSRQVTSMEIAWAAGVYEGEGCCVFTGSGTSVKILQKDPWLLYRFQELFGGTVGSQFSNQHTRRAEYGYWLICGPNMRRFLWLVYPFLSPRRQNQINTAVSRRKSSRG